jgi:transcriptional regulator with XRE-family HTH domain
MKTEQWFDRLIDKYKEDREFRLEGLILDFTEKIVSKMEEMKITRAELAKRLGVSKAFISKLLNGNPNLTIKSMMSIADALGCDLSLDICPKGFEARHFYLCTNKDMDSKKFTKPVKLFIGEEANASAA